MKEGFLLDKSSIRESRLKQQISCFALYAPILVCNWLRYLPEKIVLTKSPNVMIESISLLAPGVDMLESDRSTLNVLTLHMSASQKQNIVRTTRCVVEVLDVLMSIGLLSPGFWELYGIYDYMEQRAWKEGNSWSRSETGLSYRSVNRRFVLYREVMKGVFWFYFFSYIWSDLHSMMIYLSIDTSHNKSELHWFVRPGTLT